MWHSDKTPSPEELQVLKELEYDLFMFNPGFRSMWNNNFEEYFKALFDEEKWEKKTEERDAHLGENVSLNITKDPEFAEFMQKQAIMGEVLSGNLKIEHVPFKLQAEMKQLLKENEATKEGWELKERLGLDPFDDEDPWKKDPLFNMAFEWSEKVSKKLFPFYEETKNIDAFRILNNCGLVASKIVGASTEVDNNEMDFEWRIDRIGYTLSLTSLKRCIDSLQKLIKTTKNPLRDELKNLLSTAQGMGLELTERLEEINKKYFTQSRKM
jgi:hypothetical protein